MKKTETLKPFVIGIEAERANTDHPTGVEHYAQQLIRELVAQHPEASTEFILYLRTAPRDWILDLPKNVHVKVLRFPVLWTQLRISWEMLFHPPDVLFIPASALPLIHPANSVVTIHDIAWKFYPQTFSPFMRNYLRFSTWFAVCFARHVIAVSEQTRIDLVNAYGLPPEKVITVPHGFDAESETKIQLGSNRDQAALTEEKVKLSELPKDFILYFGTLQPRKNIIGLIDAFELMQQQDSSGALAGMSLVIAGGKGWLYDAIIERIQKNPNITYFGYVHDHFALIRKARLLVQPAFYEGFGLQLLDAFWCGVPVACSDISSLPEVAGDAAAYFDPNSVQSIASAMASVLANPGRAAELIAKGIERLKLFTWKRTAELTYTIFCMNETKIAGIIHNPHRPYTQKFWLVVFSLLQMFLAVTVATGMISSGWAWMQIVIAAIGIFAFGEYFGLLSVIIALPFWLALPNPKFDTLSAWRVSGALVVAVWVVRNALTKPVFTIAYWRDVLHSLPKWDLFLIAHIILGAVTIAFAPFPVIGIKKFLFFVSAFSLYFAALFLLRSRQRIHEAIVAFFAATATIVAIGYVQLAATFLTNTYRFWQYWATVIARSYYGSALSDSLVYSNSWFSFEPGSPPTLRMFSILPDSHAFALVAMLSFVPALALLAEAKTRTSKFWVWFYTACAALAIDLSGTRGAWAGSVVPFVIGLYFLWKWVSNRRQMAYALTPIVLLGLFVVLSPIAQKSIALLDHGYQSSSFLQRAETIYNLQESSNSVRLMIWKHTLEYDTHHLLVGTGLGNFVITISPKSSDYNSIANANQSAFNLPAKYITAHDLYLDVLTETGLLGFIPFALYVGSIIYQLWKYARRNKNQFLVAELIMAVWIFSYSVFDGTLENDRVLLFFLFGLAIAANLIRLQQREGNGSDHAA